MGYESLSQAVMQRVADWSAAYPGIPIFYEDGDLPDPDQVDYPFVVCSLKWSAGVQASIEQRPLSRVSGSLVFRVVYRDTDGVGGTYPIKDLLHYWFAFRSAGSVTVLESIPGPSSDYEGRRATSLVFPVYGYI
jgi:hypothetical protein